MTPNRSVPPRTILPHIMYRDIGAAIEWLANAFGFREHYRYGTPTSGAQLHLGDAWIMLKQAPRGQITPAQLGFGTQSLTVFVEDLEAHFARSKAAGVKLLEDLHETVYGELQYAAEDLDGHHWLFSRHARDLDPAGWGAVVAEPAIPPPQISPMLAVADGAAAVEFYKKAFGATVLWSLGSGEETIAGLSIHGAEFFLAPEAPPYGTRAPAAAGFTTVRIELFADDPAAVQLRAIAAGAIEHSPVARHTYPTSGPRPIREMLQGAVIDPIGHLWLIGKILA